MSKKYLGPWRLIFRSPKENLRTYLLTKHWTINSGKVSIWDGMGLSPQRIWVYTRGWKRKNEKADSDMEEKRE